MPSFNFQPYKMIVVRDAVMRKQLAEAMLGGNKYAVQAAPVTVVFAADTGRLALCMLALWI